MQAVQLHVNGVEDVAIVTEGFENGNFHQYRK